jgi:stage IV sporulation protein FB
MFGPVRPTRYDLAFSLLGIPVRVLPWFWLLAALFGFQYLQIPDRGPMLLLVWMGVMFVSILVHELGHAVAAWMFGYPPRIMLYQFGGLTFYEPYQDYTTARAIIITLAGPAAGFLLVIGSGIGILAMGLPLGPAFPDDLGMFALARTFEINLFWTLLNLLPILPMDGGQVCREVCMAISPRGGLAVALWISILLAAAVAAAAFLLLRQTYLAIWFVIFAVENFQHWQSRRH